MPPAYSLYIHVPFCTHRCAYCDFNTYAGLETIIPDYTDALCREIELVAASKDNCLEAYTLYFGGGTPSLLPAKDIERILSTIQSHFSWPKDFEVSLEANPGTVTLEYLKDIHSIGVHRLSLGAQSANPEELFILGRQHSWNTVVQSIGWAREAGFDNINLDLIFGLPGQLLTNWEKTLSQALSLQPEHFSLYSLTLEKGTPLQKQLEDGILPEIDPDLAADMYELATDYLESIKYAQYEISNWAKLTVDERLSPTQNPTFSCYHNLQYWHNLPYLGFGAGAHGYADSFRTVNVLHPATYIQQCLQGFKHVFPCGPAISDQIPVDRTSEIGELMMMGLRLTREGVSAETFKKRFDVNLEDLFNQPITRFSELGLLEWAGDNLRLTPRGRLLGNQVFMEFI